MKRTPHHTFFALAFAVVVSLLHLQSAPAQAQTIDDTGSVVYIYPSRPVVWESLLWPRLANSTTRQTVESGIDTGLLRLRPNGVWEILRGPSWTAFLPSHVGHVGEARKYYRYRPGWSAGPGCHNTHDEPKGQWAEVHGSPPSAMVAEDLDYDCLLYQNTRDAWCAKVLKTTCPEKNPINSTVWLVPDKVEILAPIPDTYRFRAVLHTASSGTSWNMRLTASNLPSQISLDARVAGTTRIGDRGMKEIEIKAVIGSGVAPGKYVATLRVNHNGGPTLIPVDLIIGVVMPEPEPEPVPDPEPEPEPEPTPIPIPPCERIEIVCSDVEADPSLLRTSDGVLIPCRAKLIPCT